MQWWKNGILITTLILSACSSKQTIIIDDAWGALFADENTFVYDGDSSWTIEEYEICNVLGSGNGFLITKNKYSSFELVFEFKPDANVNSGIFIRCKDHQMSYEDCYKLNIWDNHPNQSNGTGSIVQRSTAIRKVNTIGKWNTMRVTAQDNLIKIWINDILTMNYNEAESRSGVVGFQAFEEGQICFRNIRIRDMK